MADLGDDERLLLLLLLFILVRRRRRLQRNQERKVTVEDGKFTEAESEAESDKNLIKGAFLRGDLD